MDAWSIELDASELLRAFLRAGTLSDRAVLKHGTDWADLSPGKCAFAWIQHPDKFRQNPNVLIAEPAALRKVLPQLMAIPGSLSPVTAFCRIWDNDSAKLFASRTRTNVSNQVYAGFIGLIIAELFVRHGLDIDLRRVGMGVVSRLYSWSSARLALIGGGRDESERLLKAWLEAVAMTRNEVDVTLLTTVTHLSVFLQNLLNKSAFDGTPLALADIVAGWSSESADMFGSVEFNEKTHLLVREVKSMSREARLSAIEKAIKDVRAHRPHDKPEGRFGTDLLCGFLLSLIDPGSIDFIETAFQLDGGRGHVGCAYAMCAGLLGGDKFLWKHDGFGLSIISNGRTETDSFFGSSPDLSLEELRILSGRITETGFDFRTRIPTVVEVELIPDVTGCFQNGARRETPTVRVDQSIISRLERIDMLASDLTMAIGEIREGLQLPRPQVKRKRSLKG